MKRQRGFTLPELLIVGVVGLIIVGVLLFLIRPNDFAAEKRNAERLTHLASLMQAINEYHKDKGDIPPNITEEQTLVASPEAGGLGLCGDLVPKYIKDLPRDPSLSVVTIEDKNCAAPEQLYSIGYSVHVEGGRVILTAPGAEKDKTIKVEKWFSLL
jgi:prepilin-type N-terminal cleavage/methylation domain-containing protein